MSDFSTQLSESCPSAFLSFRPFRLPIAANNPSAAAFKPRENRQFERSHLTMHLGHTPDRLSN